MTCSHLQHQGREAGEAEHEHETSQPKFALKRGHRLLVPLPKLRLGAWYTQDAW